jgi:hypothetical protein
MILKGELGFIELLVLSRENTNTNDYWDANWLASEIKIEVPGFKAHYATNLRIDDLNRFYNELMSFNQLKTNDIEFNTMEEGLFLQCHRSSNGDILCKAKAINQNGDSLKFKFITHEAFILTFTSELKLILSTYIC